jgi:YVTN family beta-propeller protein
VFDRLPYSMGAAVAAALAVAGCQDRPDLGGGLVAVSDEASHRVRLLAGNGETVGELKTGERPRGMALSPDRKLLLIAASEANHIEAWRIADRRRVRVYGGISDPERLAIAPDGRAIYTANEDESTVAAIDAGSGTILWRTEVGPEPEGIAVSPDGRLVVATAEASSTVHFIAAGDGRLLASEIVGSRPRAVLFLPSRDEIWVSSELRGTIAVFDAATFRPLGMIDLVPAFPDVDNVQAVEMRAIEGTDRVFVAMGRSNRVAELDSRTRRVVRSFPSGFRTWGLALSPDKRRLYAAAGLSGDLTVIDVVENRMAGTISLGGRPWGVVAVAR